MDDLYNNAWGESSKHDYNDAPPKLGTKPFPSPGVGLKSSWVEKNTFSMGSRAVEDDEADLAAPSWSTGADIRWNEPSDDPHGFGWSHTVPDMAWGATQYDSIQLGKVEKTPEVDQVVEQVVVDPVPVSPPSTVTTTTSDIEPELDNQSDDQPVDAGYSSLFRSSGDSDAYVPSPPRSPTPDKSESPIRTPVAPAARVRSPSPDGFGGFSSGFEDTDDDDFKADTNENFQDDAWGSAWANATDEENSAPEVEEEVDDEWVAAKKRKENLDRTVPPEVLDELKKKCEDLGVKLTPTVNLKLLDFDKDSFRNNLRASMEDLEELEAIERQYIPELTLQPLPKFSETAIAKGLNNALRSTRNLPMVKESPLSRYLASKGTITWEVSVKGQKDIVEEDVVPVGWRILEKEANKPANSPEPKMGGRLFSSFWGKKKTGPTNTPLAVLTGTPTPVPLPSLGSKPSPVDVSTRSSSDRRGSVDSSQSAPSAQKDGDAFSSSPISLPPARPTSVVPPTASSPAPENSYADSPIINLDEGGTPSVAAPSTVSRFLNRFSRRRNYLPSGQQSLDLSPNDLEFLSEVVPNGTGDEPAGQKAPSAMLAPEQPLPPALAPPPASQIASSSADLMQAFTLSNTPPKPQLPQPAVSSFDSFFDALENRASTSSLPTMGTPPIRPASTTSNSSRSQSPFPPARGTTQVTPSSLVALQPATGLLPFGPPPPAPRSQTPAKGPLRPSTHSPSPSRSPPPLRPPAGLTIHAPKATDLSPGSSPNPSEPPTPASAVPLALLYPGAYNSQSESSSQSKPTSSSPISLLPPPPSVSSRAPPIPAPRPATFAKSQSFPPLPKAPSFKPPPLTISSLDDDDDFADFQSSGQKMEPFSPDPSGLSPAFRSPNSAEPMMGGFQAPVGVSRAPPNPPVLGSLFKSVAQPSKPPPLPLSSMEDEFSAFAPITTPAEPTATSQKPFLSAGAFSSPIGSLKSGPGGLNLPSATLRSPSPPKPPSKDAPSLAPPTTRAASPPKKLTPPSPSSSKAAARAIRHGHTLSLLEMANSRQGMRWPAPPSPLPQALMPPPRSSVDTEPMVDLMGDDDYFRSFESTTAPPTAAAAIAPSTSTPAMFGQPLFPSASSGSHGLGVKPPPPLFATSQSMQTVSSTGSGQWLIGSSGVTSSSVGSLQNAGAIGKTSGLSAQDLSFFEGL